MFRATYHLTGDIISFQRAGSLCLLGPCRESQAQNSVCVVLENTFLFCPAQSRHPSSIETTVLELAFITRHSELYSEFITGIPTSIVGSRQENLCPWQIYVRHFETTESSFPCPNGRFAQNCASCTITAGATATIRKVCLITGLAATSPLSVHARCLHTPYWLILVASLSFASEVSILKFGSKGGAIITSILSWQQS